MANAGDNNVYSFGSIGKHNVVVASLGVGTYGTVSAAGVANDIRRSFPQLKYGLMVRIAGAIPRPESEDGDIRLGDIIVGCVNGVPSIVNYHLGKNTADGFEIRSELAEPPEVLSRAVAALETKHQMSGPSYLTHLSTMLKNNPRLNQPKLRRDHYNLPDAKDCLFEAEPLDSAAGLSEIIREPRCLRNPPDSLKSEKFIRTRDDGFADYPVVYHGSIGSADTLMKSAIRRDYVFRMVKEQRKAKLLCFEMEAAGIVKGWPCLIIRGICDYCDSHKNDDWQNFAAATAAAYAKDLLLRIPPEAVVVARPVDEVVGKANETTRFTTTAVHPTEAGSSLPALNADSQKALTQKLIEAANRGNLAEVKRLHELGGDINSSDGPTWIPTALAAAATNYDRKKRAIAIFPTTDLPHIYEDAKKYAQVIQYLTTKGADREREPGNIQLMILEALQENK